MLMQDCKQLSAAAQNVESEKLKACRADIEKIEKTEALVRDRTRLECECRQLKADFAGMDRLTDADEYDTRHEMAADRGDLMGRRETLRNNISLSG